MILIDRLRIVVLDVPLEAYLKKKISYTFYCLTLHWVKLLLMHLAKA